MKTLIEVKTPLPLDVAATLAKAIGHLYPKSTMGESSGHFAFWIDDADRSDAEANIESLPPAQLKEEVEILLSSIKDGTFGMSFPEWFTLMMVSSFREMLTEEIENYLEMGAHDGETGADYCVIVCRSREQTPHKLRQEAELKAETYRQKLIELGVDPDSL